jgi:hypothetical protein
MPYIGNEVGNRFVASKAASVYSGDGSTTAFTLEHAVGSDEDILVSVDGVIQEPSVAYAVSSGTTLTFTAAPSSNSGNNIFVYYLFRTVATVDHPSTSSLQATDGTFSAGITGTLQTAAQTNITSVGTLTSFRSTGIDDNADALAMTIDSSENVLIGTTTTNPADNNDASGLQLSSIGSIQASVSNATPSIFNRGNDGVITGFLRAGVSVGNIVVTSSDQVYFSRATGSQGIKLKNSALMPSNADGGDSDADQDLGSSSVRWKDLYLSSGVFLGGTGSANQLDDYEEGTWTPAYSGGGSAPTVGYSQQVGSYVKVGKFVFLSFSLNTSSVSGGSSSSDLYVSGIPFACGSGTGDRGALSTVRTQNWVSNARSPVAGYINEGSSLILLSSYDAGAYSTATLCDTDDLRTTGDSNQLTATVTYISA